MKFLLIAITATVISFNLTTNKHYSNATYSYAALQDTTPKKKYDTLPRKHMDDSLNKYRRDTFNKRDTFGKKLDTSKVNN